MLLKEIENKEEKKLKEKIITGLDYILEQLELMKTGKREKGETKSEEKRNRGKIQQKAIKALEDYIKADRGVLRDTWDCLERLKNGEPFTIMHDALAKDCGFCKTCNKIFYKGLS